MREITCTNITDNISLVFNDTFSPFLLQDVDGIYEVDVNVFSSDNSLSDGATYIGSVIKPRNIVITLADKERHPRHRNLLYSLFKPRSNGIFIYHEDDGDYKETRSIEYVVEKVESTTMKHTRKITISLICPDPFFSDMYDTNVYMSRWRKLFEFQHSFLESKEELAVREVQKLVSFINDSSLDKLGIVITMEAEGNVVNPKIYHFESNSYIQIGTQANPFTMQVKDKLIISTVTNDKNAYLIRNDVRTAINELIDEGSEYIQLIPGDNTLRYSAEEGEDNLLVEIAYKQKYIGV